MKFLEKLFGHAKETDIDKVKVTSSGRFYMKSEDLFDDKDEVLSLIKKLDKSVEAYQKARSKNLAHTE
jgi:hypothetical protein